MKPIKPIFLLGLLLAGIVIVKAAVGVSGGGGVVISPGAGGSGSGATITNGSISISTNLIVTAVPSASIGSSNVLEVVNQDTNKVFQVGTNGEGRFKEGAETLLVSPSEITSSANLTIVGAPGGNVTVGSGSGGGVAYIGNSSAFGATIRVGSSEVSMENTVQLGWSADATSYGGQDTKFTRASAGTVLLGTNLVARGTITATNGVAVATNYVAANMIPQQGLIKLVGSNNVLFIVTTTTTNQIP